MKMEISRSVTGKNTTGERTIALLGTNLSYEIPISVFRATRELARKRNYRLLYFSGEAYRSHRAFDAKANMLYNLVSPRIADGMIVISNLLSSYTSPDEFRLRCLQYHPLPVVSLGIALEGIPSVVLDNTEGMYDEVSHLIEAHHLTRIAFLSGPKEHPDAKERFTAFTRAMETHGLPVDEGLLLEGSFEHESGIRAARELLDIRGKIPGRDVQAIVCCNDYMASGVMIELQGRGILIPDQIALVGFDDIQFTQCLTPPLSTVHYPFETLTARAVDILIKIMEGKKVPKVVHVGADFIPRSSCGCPDVTDYSDAPRVQLNPDRLEKNTPSRSPEHINRQIIKSIMPTFMIWKQALTRLRLEGKMELFSGADDSSKTSDRTAWEFLGRIAYDTFNNANYQTIIHNMGSALTSTLELSELLNILTRLLPGAQIGRCCVCLYESPLDSATELPPWSRLIYAFSQAGPEELPPEGLRFATALLLPQEIILKQGIQSWVVLPLYFKQEQLGYLLMDSEAPHEHLHWNLRNQISSALKGTQLLNETRMANEQKTQFFINVAHETKTPLTLIQNYLALYMEEQKPDEKLLVVKENIDLLLANMLNFLDVERLQKGQMIYQHDSLVDLSESARRKCALFRAMASKKNIRMTVDAKDRVVVKIDPRALDRIFNNLLDNAVKYIQEGGGITIDVRHERGMAMLRISDNGPGLPADASEHMFEPYYLLSKKKKSGQQGVGVGLSIVKNIVDGLGASISAENSKEGGTCFTISFADSGIAYEQETLQEIPLSDLPLSPVHENIKEKNITEGEGKPSLLVVDDNIQLLKFIQTAFSESYNVFLARSAKEAFMKLRLIPRPDVIVSDVMMDGGDGFALLSSISEKEGYNDIPFIFLTALADEKEKLKGLDLGAVDYIEKPFSIATLRAKIESIIALRHRQEKLDRERIRNSIEDILSGSNAGAEETVNSGFAIACKKYGFSDREKDIIGKLAQRFANKEIACLMNVSQRAVEYHITKIFRKCGVNSKYELLNKLQL